jgi:glutamate carboxypeptidase
MPFNEMIRATFEKARKIAAGIGMDLRASGTGGASDANFIAPLGIPVLDGLGVVGDGGHSEREFILERSLPERAELLATILSEW